MATGDFKIYLFLMLGSTKLREQLIAMDFVRDSCEVEDKLQVEESFKGIN